MHTAPILQYLRDHGQKLDSEIAAAMKISLRLARIALAELSARGEIMSCSVTRFNDGKQAWGILCRVCGTTPTRTPGPKPGIVAVTIADE